MPWHSRKRARNCRGRFQRRDAPSSDDDCFKDVADQQCQAQSQFWIDNVSINQLRSWQRSANISNEHGSEQIFDGICFACGALLWRPYHVHYIAKTGSAQLRHPPILKKFARIPEFLSYDVPIEGCGRAWLACNNCAIDWQRYVFFHYLFYFLFLPTCIYY